MKRVIFTVIGIGVLLFVTSCRATCPAYASNENVEVTNS